jgi:hypothetical protein
MARAIQLLALQAMTVLMAGLANAGAHAVEIERADATFADKRYTFELVATLDAPIDRVEAVLRDYANYPTLDQRILEAKVLDRPAANEATLFTNLRACFGPFCRTVKRTETVREEVHELRATTIADKSDVAYGETFTQLSNAGKRTRVVYRTTISPDFWIPRFVGRRVMLNTLRDATLNLFGNVERQAGGPVCLPHGDCQSSTATAAVTAPKVDTESESERPK